MANILQVEIVDSPQQAPNYSRDMIDVRFVSITKAVVVNRGMLSGKATVDFQFRDQEGGDYVAMLTGELVKHLASVITGVESRKQPPTPPSATGSTNSEPA